MKRDYNPLNRIKRLILFLYINILFTYIKEESLFGPNNVCLSRRIWYAWNRWIFFVKIILTSGESSQVLVAASSYPDWQELIIPVGFGRVGSSSRARAYHPTKLTDTYMHKSGPWTREFEGPTDLTPPSTIKERENPWSARWKRDSCLRLISLVFG